MRYAIAVLSVVLLAGPALAAEKAERQVMIESRIVEVNNAFAELSLGVARPVGDDTTWTGALGFNQGVAIDKDLGLGLQWGGKAAFRDDEPDWLVGLGVFRRMEHANGMHCVSGLQGYWQNTHDKVDLFYVKPTIGVDLNDTNYLALTGVWGINEEQSKFRIPWLYKQQGITEADAVWGLKLSNELSTELVGGYQFGDVDRIKLGTTVAWQIDPTYSLVVQGYGNFGGGYAASVGLSFDLGGKSRTDRLIKVRQDDADDYTPLPLDGPAGPYFSTIRLFR